MTFGTNKKRKERSSMLSPTSGNRISKENGNKQEGTVSPRLLGAARNLADRSADTFDFLLTRDLSRGHIVDFNPYTSRTDPLLFTYDELLDLLVQASSKDFTPELRVIDSRSHPATTHNAPTHQHNMVPIEALALSQGRSLEEFAGVWQDQLRRSTVDTDDDSG